MQGKGRAGRRLCLTAGTLLAAYPALAETPYSMDVIALAQRYYRICRAEQRLHEQVARDFNERQVPEPPLVSAREGLSAADRRDFDLVCLGAVQQELEDMRVVTLPGERRDPPDSSRQAAPPAKPGATAATAPVPKSSRPKGGRPAGSSPDRPASR